MEKKKRTIRTEVDASLVRQMQAGVAGASRETLGEAFAPAEPGAGHQALGALPSPDHRAPSNRPSHGPAGPRKAAPRTTLSVPCEVGGKARRLTLALTFAEGLEASIGATISRALDLLERHLEEAGVSIPEKPVKLRSGPRHI